MRRVALTAILAGAVLGGSACAGEREPTAAPGTTPPSSAAPTYATPTQPAEQRADTKRICGQTDKIFTAGLKDFGAELGRMIAFKQAKDTAKADQSRNAAEKQLTSLADDVREATADAVDPELRDAGKQAADKITATAGRDAFYGKIDAMKDLSGLEAEMRAWFAPLAAVCT
jgi:hypothetical protein